MGLNLAVKDKDNEKRVEEQDAFGVDGGNIQKHSLRRLFHAVCQKRRLNHEQHVWHRLAVERHALKGGLVGAIVEHLKKRRSAKIIDELGQSSSERMENKHRNGKVRLRERGGGPEDKGRMCRAGGRTEGRPCGTRQIFDKA